VIVYGPELLFISPILRLVTDAFVCQIVKVSSKEPNDRAIEEIKLSVHELIWPCKNIGVVELSDEAVKSRR
jgi:hypothetical protein